MPSMPGRPRAHELETASERAFERILPDAWTVSLVQPDYGFDRRVEIFENKTATGLGFLVQLKATDADLRQALTESLQVSVLNYMQTQVEPVLVVRHHAPTGRIFGFWMHRRDVVLKRDDQKTVTMRWALDDELTSMSVGDLLREVQRTRALRTTMDEGRPLRIGLSEAEPSAALRLSLSRTIRTLGKPFILVASGDPAEIQLAVNRNELVADLAISSSAASIVEGDPSSKAADLMLLAAVSLSKIGRSSLAVAILRQCENSSLLKQELWAAMVANFLVVAKAWRTAGEFLSHPALLLDHGYAIIVATGFNSVEAVTHDEALHFSKSYMQRAEAINALGEPRLAAGFAYTAGNLFFHRANEWVSAEFCYARAHQLDASYESRHYFCCEFAASKFEIGDFVASADWYSRAHRLEPADAEILARRADALACAGQYQTGSSQSRV